ncbi:hypothetical protein BGW36DRAFT_424450 [Talaromyces proteolyticus]|uniref:Uncharacterized protein n=1 Tax=Talaromyces proteolyticus TaxID=1131652 RepID=A0AAD4L1J2_9EURO|nr:uncharacterized protein BGW36DRAFT_424450 [Talaromyces proteolyticus]KAH8702165.1 hypothetical protein BGW36DRAFT_424450 [Talaromyces proteolyticus]
MGSSSKAHISPKVDFEVLGNLGVKSGSFDLNDTILCVEPLEHTFFYPFEIEKRTAYTPGLSSVITAIASKTDQTTITNYRLRIALTIVTSVIGYMMSNGIRVLTRKDVETSTGVGFVA